MLSVTVSDGWTENTSLYCPSRVSSVWEFCENIYKSSLLNTVTQDSPPIARKRLYLLLTLSGSFTVMSKEIAPKECSDTSPVNSVAVSQMVPHLKNAGGLSLMSKMLICTSAVVLAWIPWIFKLVSVA